MTTLTIKTKKVGASDNVTTVGNIIVNGSLNSLAASTTNLGGDITISGTVNSITLANVADDHTITLTGTGASAKQSVAIKLGDVTDLVLNSPVLPIRSLSAKSWNDTDGSDADAINTPAIGSLSVAGDFEADLNLTNGNATSVRKGLSSANISGAISGSAWNIVGGIGSVKVSSAHSLTINNSDGQTVATLMPLPAGIVSLSLGSVLDASVTVAGNITSARVSQWLAGSITAEAMATLKTTGDTKAALRGDFKADVTLTTPLAAKVGATKSLSTFSVAGFLDGAVVSTNGDISTITLGGIKDSNILVAVKDTVAGLPGALSDFIVANDATIGSLTIMGIKTEPFATVNSIIAALRFGKLTLNDINFNNGGNLWGVAADKIGSFAFTRKGITMRSLDAPRDFYFMDFRLRLV